MEKDLIASKPSIRSGGFTMGPRNSVSSKGSMFADNQMLSSGVGNELNLEK